MGVINRFPSGFLEFFEMKSGGFTPKDVSEFVTPQIDVVDMYMHKRFETESSSGAVTAVGNSVTMVVPDSETWVCYGTGAAGNFTGGVAQTIGLQVQLITVRDNNSYTLDQRTKTVAATAVAGTNARVFFSFSRPTFFSGGSGFRVRVNELDLGGQPNVLVSVNAWIARIGPGTG